MCWSRQEEIRATACFTWSRVGAVKSSTGICLMSIPILLGASKGSGASERLSIALIPILYRRVKASSDSGYAIAASLFSKSQSKLGRITCRFSSSVRSYSCKNFNGLFMSCTLKAGSRFALTFMRRNTSMDMDVLSSCFATEPYVVYHGRFYQKSSKFLNITGGEHQDSLLSMR